MTLTLVYRSYQGHVSQYNHCVTVDVKYLGNRYR